jgi:hypothetical protein
MSDHYDVIIVGGGAAFGGSETKNFGARSIGQTGWGATPQSSDRRPRQHQSHRHDDRRTGGAIYQGTVVRRPCASRSINRECRPPRVAGTE